MDMGGELSEVLAYISGQGLRGSEWTHLVFPSPATALKWWGLTVLMFVSTCQSGLPPGFLSDSCMHSPHLNVLGLAPIETDAWLLLAFVDGSHFRPTYGFQHGAQRPYLLIP